MKEANELRTFTEKFSTQKKRYMREYAWEQYFSIVEQYNRADMDVVKSWGITYLNDISQEQSQYCSSFSLFYCKSYVLRTEYQILPYDDIQPVCPLTLRFLYCDRICFIFNNRLPVDIPFKNIQVFKTQRILVFIKDRCMNRHALFVKSLRGKFTILRNEFLLIPTHCDDKRVLQLSRDRNHNASDEEQKKSWY